MSVPTGGRHRARRRPTGRGRWAVGLATALALGGGGWVAADGAGPGRADPAVDHLDGAVGRADPAADPADPVGAAVALTRRRAEVLASGDPGRVAEVAREGSPAFAADRALLDRLTASGVRLDGLAAVVGEASRVDPPGAAVASPGQDTVDVRVSAGVTAHERRSPTGITDVPAQAPRVVVLRVVWGVDGWRVAEVRPG